MFITKMIAQEQHARKEIERMGIQDLDWLNNSAEQVFKSQVGIGKKREITQQISDNCGLLWERVIYPLELPEGDAVELILDEAKINHYLRAWSNQVDKTSTVWSVVCEFWEEMHLQKASEEFSVYAYQRADQILALSYIDISNPSMWSIQAFVVSPSFQREGIGSRLVNQIALDAPEQIVVSPVVSACSFYAKLGFCVRVDGLTRDDAKMYRITASEVSRERSAMIPLIKQEKAIRASMVQTQAYDRDWLGYAFPRIKDSKLITELWAYMQKEPGLYDSSQGRHVSLVTDPRELESLFSVLEGWKNSAIEQLKVCTDQRERARLKAACGSSDMLMQEISNINEDHYFCVCKDDQNSILCIASVYLDAANLTLDALVTNPSVFGQGAGSAMLECLKNSAKKRNLKIDSAMRSAIPFYLARGFYPSLDTFHPNVRALFKPAPGEPLRL